MSSTAGDRRCGLAEMLEAEHRTEPKLDGSVILFDCCVNPIGGQFLLIRAPRQASPHWLRSCRLHGSHAFEANADRADRDPDALPEGAFRERVQSVQGRDHPQAREMTCDPVPRIWPSRMRMSSAGIYHRQLTGWAVQPL